MTQNASNSWKWAFSRPRAAKISENGFKEQNYTTWKYRACRKGLGPKANGRGGIKPIRYDFLLNTKKLHWADPGDNEIVGPSRKQRMQRRNAPLPMVVLENELHLAGNMTPTVTFWFRPFEPLRLLTVEDIEPLSEMNFFRTQFLPRLMSNPRYCGDPAFPNGGQCFPERCCSVHNHCELHIFHQTVSLQRSRAWRNPRCQIWP